MANNEYLKHPQLDEIRQDLLDSLKSGDGGGTYDGMEARIKTLEGTISEVRRDLTEIRITLAKIDTELHHKVSYKWLTIYFLGLAAVILRAEIAALFS